MILIALGGNALLRRGEPLTAGNQRRNVRSAARALAPIAREHELVISQPCSLRYLNLASL